MDHALHPVGHETPLYRVVADRIRRTILAGSIAPGDAIPSEHQLMDAHAVSRITVRRALDELTRKGLVERRQGRASRVRRLEGMRPLAGEQQGDIKNLMALADATEVRLVETGHRPLPDDIAAALGLTAGTSAFFCRRVRLHNGSPFCASAAWVPREFAGEMTDQALVRLPMLSLMAAAGAHPVRTDQAISAVAAGPDDAARLEVEERSPLLEVTRVLHDEDDRAIQHLTLRFRSDRYRYYMTMLRGQETHDAGVLF
jgi:GntR family transcriptional regulator